MILEPRNKKKRKRKSDKEVHAETGGKTFSDRGESKCKGAEVVCSVYTEQSGRPSVRMGMNKREQ